jgi:uncharacterized damage-inducible protein DinB
MENMFTVDGNRKLHQWTHACLTVLLSHVSTLPVDAYTRVLPSFGFNTVQKQVIHIFNCEGFWISILQGREYTDRNPDELSTVGEAVQFKREVRDRTLEYLAGLTEQQLNSAAELNFPDGDHAVRTPALILHHVFTHAFHHKGQIVAMCRELGHPVPDTDLNQFE